MHTYGRTNKELTVLVPLPAADVRAKEIEWKCTTAELRVRARGADLLCGSFFKPVKPDDSTWEIEDAPGGGRRLRLGLAKARANEKWECLMRDEVDTTVTSRVFLDLSIGGAPLGRVTLGLYGNAAPRTAENFRCLCTGERGLGQRTGTLPLARGASRPAALTTRRAWQASRCTSATPSSTASSRAS